MRLVGGHPSRARAGRRIRAVFLRESGLVGQYLGTGGCAQAGSDGWAAGLIVRASLRGR